MADHGVTTVLQTLPYFERSDERQRPKCCRRVQLECSCSKSRTLGRHVRQARESLTGDTWDQARLGRHGQNNIGIASPNFWQGRALWRWSKSVRPAEATTKLGGVSGRLNVNRFGHLKVNIRTCKSEQKSEHFSRVRTAPSVAIKGRRPSALRAFTPPLAAVEARGAGEPGPFELRLCGPFPCRKVVAA